MDNRRFGPFVSTLSSGGSRRGVLHTLGAGALAAVIGRFGVAESADARKKRKTKGAKRLQRNAFGCVDIGKACRGNNGNCCSGICQGKKPKNGDKDKSRCAAHNVLDCQAAQDSCQGEPIPCGTAGACTITTGQASFCSAAGEGECAACRTDADCEAGRGPGAACIVCPGNCPETTTARFAAGA